MSESDLVVAAAAYNALMQSWVVTYLAMVAAYLVTAYTVGSKFTQTQIVIVTVCFTIGSALCAYAAAAAGTRSLEFTIEMHTMNAERASAMSLPILYIASASLFLGILFALKFMWDIRHSKTG